EARLKSSTGGKERLPIPFWPVKDRTHGSIVSDPPDYLIDLIVNARGVVDPASFEAWCAEAQAKTSEAREELEKNGEVYQQFVVHARDQNNDPVSDFHLDVKGMSNGALTKSWDDDN